MSLLAPASCDQPLGISTLGFFFLEGGLSAGLVGWVYYNEKL